MTQTLYDNEMLRRYLLGAATAEEVARLDELSLTDDDCALALASVENDLVDAYACDGLNAADRVQFERHYLASPLRREKVHFAQELQRLGQRAAATSKSETPRPAARFAWLRLPPLWQAGLATAALVLLAGCFWLFAENRRLRRQAEAERAALAQRATQLEAAATNNQEELARMRERLAQLEARPSAQATSAPAPVARLFTFALAAPLRGASDPPQFAIPQQVSDVTAKLALETSAYPRYRVALRDPLTNRILWQSGELAARGKTVIVRLPGRLFAAQRYAFELSGVAASGAEERLSSYPFSVVRR